MKKKKEGPRNGDIDSFGTVAAKRQVELRREFKTLRTD